MTKFVQPLAAAGDVDDEDAQWLEGSLPGDIRSAVHVRGDHRCWEVS